MTISKTAELQNLLKQQMGFNEYEISPFFSDILFYVNKKRRLSKKELNAELESLGWGVSLIDDAIYSRIHTLLGKSYEL